MSARCARRSPGGIQAQRPVRAATDHSAVVIVLAVVFPATFPADSIAAALVKGRVTTARARVGLWPGGSKDVPLGRVRVEPVSSPFDEFLI